MKAPWILIWALAAVPVFAQGPFPADDRGEAFDVILDFVDEARAEELQGSRDVVDALRQELVALRDTDTPDEDAITSAREDLNAARRDLSDELRTEIRSNEDLQAELRSLAQEARQDRIETVAAFRDERFDAVLDAASDDQVPVLVDNRDTIASLTDELRSLRDEGASRDEVADQREELRTLQSDQRELVRDIVAANEDLRSELLADAREVRRDVGRDVRDSRDRFRRDRRDRRPGDVPADPPSGG